MKSIISVSSFALSIAMAVSVQRDPLLTWAPKVKDSPYPVDFHVPHLGADKDMIETKKHYEEQEKIHGHFWDVLKPKPDPHPMDYFVPHFGSDPDIMTT